jgi:hypothetical protein
MRARKIAVAILVIAALLIGAFLFYASRNKSVVLFYYGAAPEVPQGRVIVIFNPFRNRDSENTAERFIRDLRTGDCQRIVQGLNPKMEYDPRVCLVMHNTTKQSLVWREDREQDRMLVYRIPEQQANLWIGLRQDEGGFGISWVSVVR